MLYTHIKKVQFDLNVTCNAYCPGCHRYKVVNGEMWLNPYLEFNTNLSLDAIERVFKNSRLSSNVWVDMVGLVGEPIAHPKFLDIIDIIHKHRPNARINIHTNGGLRSTAFFVELAGKLHTTNSVVRFSIDGLQDTNDIYRIGVNWDKAIANLTAFVNAGGNAVWKMIEFPWNQHQSADAEKYAMSLGVGYFELEQNRSQGGDETDMFMNAAQRKIHKKTPAPKGITPYGDKSYALTYDSFNEINQRCFDNEEIYINAHGKVLPCCMMNAGLTDEGYMDSVTKFLYEEDDSWNDLNNYTMESILSNKWWSKLKDSFTIEPCSVCVHSCDKR